ncbi:hypothetical protein SCOCK_150054 [Actinacidiphila cocklensis]|uniref:Uncharacterized protein n=1 Tax=Actinacidiphila cocklensis TaxID=887465 RepID=A0A9W4GPB4_9ACTN|nr:hypothetical protein SCOCK_150054 [Actinacidiphila cocklensis]
MGLLEEPGLRRVGAPREGRHDDRDGKERGADPRTDTGPAFPGRPGPDLPGDGGPHFHPRGDDRHMGADARLPRLPGLLRGAEVGNVRRGFRRGPRVPEVRRVAVHRQAHPVGDDVALQLLLGDLRHLGCRHQRAADHLVVVLDRPDLGDAAVDDDHQPGRQQRPLGLRLLLPGELVELDADRDVAQNSSAPAPVTRIGCRLPTWNSSKRTSRCSGGRSALRKTVVIICPPQVSSTAHR